MVTMSAFLATRDLNSLERPPRMTRLFYERDISGDTPPILLKFFPELRSKEVVFNAHANLRADEEHGDGKEEERQRRRHKARGEQDAKHGRVNRMAHKTIRSRHDELVIGTEAGVNAPLPPERAGARPGKKNSQGKKDDGKCNLPSLRLALPELALPQERVADGDDHHAPAGAPVNLLGWTAAAFDQGEWRHPKEPSGGEGGVSRRGHARDCSLARVLGVEAKEQVAPQPAAPGLKPKPAGTFAQRPQG